MELNDLDYRPLYCFSDMVKDLIREFVPEPWVEQLDFSTLQRVDTPFAALELEGRERGLFWKLCLHEGSPVYIYLVVGHQSEIDRFVAVHMLAGIGRLYDTLTSEGTLPPEGYLPLVIPILLLTGDTEWEEPQELAELTEHLDESMEEYIPRLRYLVIAPGCLAPEDLEKRQSITAQIFWLQRSWEPEALKQGIGRLIPLLASSEDEVLRGAILEWFGDMLAARRDIPEALGPEEFEALLAKRVEGLNRLVHEEDLN